MWMVQNSTKLAADRAIIVDKNGAKQWVVVVKGTFDIAPDGTTKAAEEQVEVFPGPEYRGKPGESSLVYEQDLVASKPRTDVYVNGTAHAPNERPTTRMTVGLGTPLGTKSILVHGDRRWERDLVGGASVTPPLPFLQMPIVYERAFGGYDHEGPDPSAHRMDPRNSVGTGVFAKAAHRIGKLLPNLTPMDGSDTPVGFGALCSFWEPRSRHQGTYDAAWLEHRKPLVPSDWDPQWLQCAPPDQQMAPYLRGGEPFAVLGMTPSGTLRFDLPKHYFAFTTHIGKRTFEHRAQIQTVVIEPDHPRVIVVWHTMLACHHLIDDIDYTEIVEKPYI
jgi:hypothetical protein